jgi:DNA invertase Pin-like site-specific DNA recombinase
MLVGYARVSTADQTVALQEDALRTAGCTTIFTDQASGARREPLRAHPGARGASGG